jgi:RNA polymerase sigma-70 factor (ECF subfamily)
VTADPPAADPPAAGHHAAESPAGDHQIDEPLAALRRGDEQAFRALVCAHQSALLRLALLYAPSRAVAEEIVQETWLAVLGGLDGFQGRASLRTWISRILVNIARRRSGKEARSVPFSAIPAHDHRNDGQGAEPAVDPSRFLADGPYAGHWSSFPDDWSGVPEHALLGREARTVTQTAIAQLSTPQQTVIVLRDIEGWTGREVSELMGVTEGHQRVLLHRARSKIRQALEDYLG